MKPDSPYKGGTFNFNLTLPENFPFKAPTVTFTTKIYHPGINEEGAICVPVLRDEWKPTVTLTSVLNIVQEKLNNPSPDDPFEPQIAQTLKEDKAKFLATAKEWTKKCVANYNNTHAAALSESLPQTCLMKRSTRSPMIFLSSAFRTSHLLNS
ncbi:UBC-like protein [Coprinellus micaceus]|uniref:UBC-like protein n=1 Tax=Coprinellus micaceus TaxID=71717 RepID=A0A4Y7TRK8_COPMI|nr:UBC-like protein [Coprinellus micaceus]